MSGMESAYLALVIGAMGIFAAALAFTSWEWARYRRSAGPPSDAEPAE